MSGISTGIGLISGIDTATLINQLIAIESRPKILAISRQTQLQNEQAAFMGLNSLLLSLGTAAGAFAKDRIFHSATATSSSSSILTATASNRALPGSYQFIVDRVVSSHQLISRGFGDSDETQLGSTGITFEWGNGKLESDTRLATLNGGAGVARGKIQIEDSQGGVAVIDLSRAISVSDVLDAINADETIDVTASIAADGSGLVITDDLGGTITVSNMTGYTTATELGIAGSDAGGTITGSQINYLSGSSLLSDLNDGNGVLISSGLGVTDFSINTADGSQVDVTLGERTVGEDVESAVTTLEGVIDRINELGAGLVQASIGDDGVSLKLEDLTVGGSTFEVVGGLNGDQTARDLGLLKTGAAGVIAGDRITAGMNSVLVRSLNGGAGLNGSTTLDITNRNGAFTSLSLGENASLSEIIEQINDAGAGVTASVNAAGTGLLITDTSGGSGNLILQGSAAAALGLDTGASGVAADSFTGSNIQLQYVSGATRLDDLNYGRGIGTGKFKITDAMGGVAEIDIGSDDTTLQDVINEINAAVVEVEARINDQGDGIIIESTAANPTTAIEITAVSGSTAKDLNILGTAADVDTANFIDGSYERTVELETTDTLDDVIQKINDANLNVVATLINDGAGGNPYRLNLTSELSGTAGEMSIEMDSVDLALQTTTQPQDAVVFFGSSDPAEAVLITSSTNTLDSLITGVSINLVSESDEPVTLTVGRDTEKMVASVTAFVDAFNAVIDRMNSLDSYDAENETRGVLLGNSTLSRIRNQLYRTVQGEPEGVDTSLTRLTQIGIQVGEDGNLELDSDKLREAINDDLEAVENLLAAKVVAEDQDIDLGGGASVESEELIYDSLGVAELMRVLVEQMTDSIDGTLTITTQTYDRKIELQTKRIEAFDEQLEQKREILERQFAAMEVALASLQAQQSALSSMSPIAAR